LSVATKKDDLGAAASSHPDHCRLSTWWGGHLSQRCLNVAIFDKLWASLHCITSSLINLLPNQTMNEELFAPRYPSSTVEPKRGSFCRDIATIKGLMSCLKMIVERHFNGTKRQGTESEDKIKYAAAFAKRKSVVRSKHQKKE
jgi:hypothetical protein